MAIAIEHDDSLARCHAEDACEVMRTAAANDQVMAGFEGLICINTVESHFAIIPYLSQRCKI
jgi:hypothetical protein